MIKHYMNRMRWIIFIGVFVFGLASGLGWLVSIPVLRYASLSSVLRSQLSSCSELPVVSIFEGSPQQRCYNKTLVAMVRSYGISSTISALKSYMKTPKGNFLQGMRCHALAHEIGNAAARFGTPSDVLMTQCIGLCDFGSGRNPIVGLDLGCMNGAGHTWVLLNANIQDAFGKCAVPSIPENVRQGCYHGIGHGLSERYGDDLTGAISQCLLLPNKEAKYQCAHAIFMAPRQTSTMTNGSFDLIGYCRTLSDQVQASCFEFSGFMIFSSGKNAKEAMRVCDKTPEALQVQCRNRVGEAMYTLHKNPSDIQACSEGVTGFANDCVTGFVRTVIDTVNDTRGDLAIQACSALPEQLQYRCFEVVGVTLFLRYGEGVRQETCKKIISPTYVQACLKSVEL